jgi:hypothetical protein
MSMTPDKALALRQPFPKESVGQLPKGGAMLDYVGHAAVTDRLLTVDPEWNWEPFATHPQSGLPLLDEKGNLWIRLTVCGVTRIGVGDGKSLKECIGDALRNAAMRFGVALDLWAKENLVEFAQAAREHRSTGVAGLRAAVAPEVPPEVVASLPPAPDNIQPGDLSRASVEAMAATAEPKLSPRARGAMFAEFARAGIPDDEQLPGIAHLIGRTPAHRDAITTDEYRVVMDALKTRPSVEVAS